MYVTNISQGTLLRDGRPTPCWQLRTKDLLLCDVAELIFFLFDDSQLSLEPSGGFKCILKLSSQFQIFSIELFLFDRDITPSNLELDLPGGAALLSGFVLICPLIHFILYDYIPLATTF